MTAKSIISVVAVTVLMAGISTHAHAAGPTRVDYELSFVDFPIGPDWCPGYGFGVIADAYYDVTEFWFPDHLRLRLMIREGAYKNSADPTRMVVFRGAKMENQWIDFGSGVVAVSGQFNVVLPGHGLLLKNAGRVLIDGDGNITFMAGRRDLVDGNLDALCQYLAGP